jgi:hypothetical protein
VIAFGGRAKLAELRRRFRRRIRARVH